MQHVHSKRDGGKEEGLSTHSKHTRTKDMHSMLVSLKTMHKRKQYKEHPIASSFMHAV